jgi:ribosome-binding protein aMBF1 (putative translation factor)
VALLGIAQRSVHINFVQNVRKNRRAKPLPESIKTIGDWIYVKRLEKNLTSGHLALKMGIAAALVQAWEDGTSQPNEQQQAVLAKIFGVEPAIKDVF